MISSSSGERDSEMHRRERLKSADEEALTRFRRGEFMEERRDVVNSSTSSGRNGRRLATVSNGVENTLAICNHQNTL